MTIVPVQRQLRVTCPGNVCVCVCVCACVCACVFACVSVCVCPQKPWPTTRSRGNSIHYPLNAQTFTHTHKCRDTHQRITNTPTHQIAPASETSPFALWQRAPEHTHIQKERFGEEGRPGVREVRGEGKFGEKGGEVTPSRTYMCKYARTLTHMHAHSLSLTHTLTHTQTQTIEHTHTHTHTGRLHFTSMPVQNKSLPSPPLHVCTPYLVLECNSLFRHINKHTHKNEYTHTHTHTHTHTLYLILKSKSLFSSSAQLQK